MRLAQTVLITALLFMPPLLLSCAPGGFSPQEAPPALARGFAHETLVFRHKITIDIPGDPPRSFDGVMRLDGRKNTAHIAGLGGMGLTLFSMSLSPESRQTVFLHPSLARIPHIEDHIALCIRSIWFDTLALAQRPSAAGRKSIAELVHGDLLEHVFVNGHILESRSITGNHRWTVRLDAPFSPGANWPRQLSMRHEKPDYSISIRLLSFAPEQTDKAHAAPVPRRDRRQTP